MLHVIFWRLDRSSIDQLMMSLFQYFSHTNPLLYLYKSLKWKTTWYSRGRISFDSFTGKGAIKSVQEFFKYFSTLKQFTSLCIFLKSYSLTNWRQSVWVCKILLAILPHREIFSQNPDCISLIQPVRYFWGMAKYLFYCPI